MSDFDEFWEKHCRKVRRSPTELECYQAGSDARKEKDAEIAEQMEHHKGRQVAAAIRNQEE